MSNALPAVASSPACVRLVTIALPRDDMEGQLVRNLLADAGIEATVTGGSLAGFRAETPSVVCVLVRSEDAAAARAALAAPRPVVDDADVGDDAEADAPAVGGGFSAAILCIAAVLLSLAGVAVAALWAVGFPGLHATPIDLLAMAGMLLLWWSVWWRRR